MKLEAGTRPVTVNVGTGKPVVVTLKKFTLSFDEAVALPRKPQIDLVALDDALNQLSAMDARQSQIVDLRFIAGLSIDDTSSVLGVSPATVKREWSTARMWLQRESRRGEAHDS
jgi:DNA-directed RNA polymerase specialized sigma24 family protein